MKQLAIVFCSFALLLAAQSANAAYRFGKDEKIHHIQDVKMKGANGEALFLAYKTSSQSFLLPVYITDDGYVLGLKDSPKKYYSLPDGERLKTIQAAGNLPDPLPPYSLTIMQLIFGHSLWIAVAIFLIWLVSDMIARRRKRARKKEAA